MPPEPHPPGTAVEYIPNFEMRAECFAAVRTRGDKDVFICRPSAEELRDAGGIAYISGAIDARSSVRSLTKIGGPQPNRMP
jgi:hypothetical protein